jgi:hypothetical protein
MVKLNNYVSVTIGITYEVNSGFLHAEPVASGNSFRFRINMDKIA